jgi:hypothetical protein
MNRAASSPPVPAFRHWLAGFAFSVLFAWVVSAVFLNSISPIVWDEQVGLYVAPPGTVYRHRSEGWASSRTGPHGIKGLPADVPAGPKVFFWGNSFVDAVSVDDPDKMAQAFSSLCREHGLGLLGLGLGGGGESAADYSFKMRAFEREVGPIALHVIVLGSMGEVLPDLERHGHSRFFSTAGGFGLEKWSAVPSAPALRWTGVLHDLHLAGAYELYVRLRDLHLRLRPGTARESGAEAPPGDAAGQASPDTLRQGWEFLLQSLLCEARAPILFVHIPAVPRLVRGSVDFSEPDAGLARAFGEACARQNVGFLDLAGPFTEHFRATGRFTRGFANTPPGQGHLNQDGQRLAAQAVFRYIRGQGHALFAR